MAPSVGRPPSIRVGGAGACVTPSVQVRQAYLGRTVTSTRSCAGTRRHVQPLGAVLTDLVHLRRSRIGHSDNGEAAARANKAVGLDHLLDPRQVLWQVAAIALGLG